MNDQSGHAGVITNGTSKVTDAKPAQPTREGRASISARSIDERLEALMETVRTWNWRTVSLEAGLPPTDQTTLTVPGPPPIATATARENLEPLAHGPYMVQASAGSGPADTQPVVLEPTHSPVTDPFVPDEVPVDPNADTQTVLLEQTPRPVTDLSLPVDPEDASDDTGAPPARGPRPWTETWHDPIDRVWSQRWVKLAVLCVAAAVVVFLIIWGIRFAARSPGAGTPSPTTVPRRAAVHIHHHAFVAPIPAAQLARYQTFAQGLQSANAAATGAFVGAGSTPTTTQLAPAVTAYRAALNLYDFQLHFIQWPASMQPAITVEHAQLEALVSFLQSLPYVSPTGVSPWLSQLHVRAATAQTADNQVRQDLGLPGSSSFP